MQHSAGLGRDLHTTDLIRASTAEQTERREPEQSQTCATFVAEGNSLNQRASATKTGFPAGEILGQELALGR